MKFGTILALLVYAGAPSAAVSDQLSLAPDFIDVCAKHVGKIKSAKQKALSVGYEKPPLGALTGYFAEISFDLHMLTGEPETLVKFDEGMRRYAFFAVGEASSVFEEARSVCSVVVTNDNPNFALAELVDGLFLGDPANSHISGEHVTYLWEFPNLPDVFIRFSYVPTSETPGYEVSQLEF
ncbi:hypothetical protein ATO10_11922 [Actibacterium atlanticum]|uniref:Uncharacterized protein n=1 Tax=Actibacterium atlanticum TaxID=1461693 RepID=A0A058ZJ18_9RHOB|nr:hypothetical protein [Actibacterium atlanticum]KCV81619.1 hypothetical protein ATO10_11922 [Actibacterium atlanticum]